MGVKENIIALRIKYGLSQKDLALIAGVSDKAISSWENGTREPRMGAIQKIADHFGLKKSDIIEDTDVNPNQVSKYLTLDEDDLIEKYRQLDADDQEEVVDIIDSKLRRAKRKSDEAAPKEAM